MQQRIFLYIRILRNSNVYGINVCTEKFECKNTVFLEANFKRILYNFTAMARLFRVASFYGPFNVFDQSQTHSKETAKKKHQICKPFTIIPII